MLELKNVSKFYYKKGMINTGFSKINLKFDIGEFIAITGESGSGKSTLLNVISGLDSYEEGEMYINGEETSYYTEKDYEKYRKKYIGNIFQNFNLVNSYTVYQNIELIYLLNGFKAKDVKAKVLDLIDKVDLKKYKNRKVSKLSGGQKQRVAIARALAQNTPIILADEPTGNLDKRSSENILKLLYEISKDKLVIIVTHNYEQIEEYVTRKITMNDGKVIEDKKIKNFDEVKNVELSNYSDMKSISKVKLGVRNAFNILSKFLLITVVYLFVVLSMFAVYGTFNDTQNLSSNLSDNYYFNTTDLGRVIITKKDKSVISDEDYEKLSKVSNISKIYKKDILLDNTISLNDNESYYFYGRVKSISDVNTVDYGRLPENANELVIFTNPNYSYYLSEENVDEALKKNYYLDTFYNKREVYKIVGVIYTDSGYDDYLYFTDNGLNKLYDLFIEEYTEIKYTMFNKEYNNYIGSVYNELIPSKKVPKGKAYISEDYSYYCKNFNCKNYKINIKSNNPNVTYNKTIKVSKMYNKNNFKKLLNLKYDDYNGAIFINDKDYNNLFDRANYQSSIFIEEEKYVDDTLNELDKMGYKTLYLKSTLGNGDMNTIVRVLNIVRVIVNVSLVVVLFFISYFIIKLILKSRNVYYSTLRILGSTFKNTKKLLNIELFTLANLAYFIFLICIYLNQKNIVKIGIVSSSIKYMNAYHYIIIYILIAFMTVLTTQRYSRKLFVNSVMNTYREEV